ncbi:nucleoside-diphosphate sugar epimerase/dehydratase [Marinicella sp. S1101]|uniref:polysaccharide biosynthesis protein n=1 Tax=Marinicella marina TaxID=2996016 RepID=UPI002260F7B3|nr:nucleoside-diphosphate sugar epimerase/dehydratase [Marinicella marina]MCX7553508.1 nucleoside-diphosphate sugar epimerase/dehydratase [Marinicella marina]MDJ1140132.1 nucleoside-diphosphate sugar epimerase/dehydratase [Marinicella marina]
MKNRILHLRLAVVAHDLFMTWLAWVCCFFIRYSIWPESPAIELWSAEILAVMVIQAVICFAFNMYRGLWRFASVPDLINLVKSATVGTLAIVLFFFLFNRLDGIPRSVLLMYPVLLVLFWGGPRITYRLWKDQYFNLTDHDRPRVLLIGAGHIAELFIRNAASNHACQVIRIIDDSKEFKGTQIRGVKIQSGLDNLLDLVDDFEINLVVIAKQQPEVELIKKVIDELADSNCTIRVAPDPEDFDQHLININQLQPITVEDLLGRDKVELDWQQVAEYIKNKSVMVTGGGGSIGSELCRQLAKIGVSKLSIIEHSEYNLYAIDKELNQHQLVTSSHLCDVTNQAHLYHIFKQAKPDVVFHAAAYKHVPLLESHACEGFLNNVIGTQNVADCCADFGVEKMVLISTDKAVNPHSVMGATKRLSEKYCQFKNERFKTEYLTVRFGNVLGSAGSVVPLFEEQIAKGGPVTVTHEDMERYFMTIEEACQLILQSLVLGNDNEILVLDMGQPIKIKSLAERMIALSGKGKEISIKITGLRGGEKLYEELHYDIENLEPTNIRKISGVRNVSTQTSNLPQLIQQGHQAALKFDQKVIKQLLTKLVPEFKGHELAVLSDVSELQRKEKD